MPHAYLLTYLGTKTTTNYQELFPFVSSTFFPKQSEGTFLKTAVVNAVLSFEVC